MPHHQESSNSLQEDFQQLPDLKHMAAAHHYFYQNMHIDLSLDQYNKSFRCIQKCCSFLLLLQHHWRIPENLKPNKCRTL